MAIQDESITFHTDQVKVYGPKVDQSFNITLSVGEYEKDKMAQLMMLPSGHTYEVEVKFHNATEKKPSKENVGNGGI